MIYRFDSYELDTGVYELRRAGALQRLEPQVFDVLAYLVEHRDRLVTKDELLERVWGDKFISEAALNSRIMAARKAIGDNGQEQRLIRTQHGRGFRFVGQVATAEVVKTPVSSVSEEPPKPARLRGSQERQTIRFCETADGVHIAYATVGEGPAILKAPNWLTHLEYEWQTPFWRHWWQELASDYTVVRFDLRGTGLSDRNVDDMSFPLWVSDMEAVAEASGLEKFALLGISGGGPIAIEYAIRHPEKVTHLVFFGAFARGWEVRGESLEEQRALLTLMREGWGRDTPTYRQMFTMSFIPDATPEQVQWFNELQRVSASPENAARLRTASGKIDVTHLLPKLNVPTLVLHATGDQRVPFAEGRLLAAKIPGARFVALDSRNHLPLQEEPAWTKLITEVRAFLDETPSVSPVRATGTTTAS